MVYLSPQASEADLVRIQTLIEAVPWVRSARAVSADEAGARFLAAFPSMADLLEGWDRSPLPTSLAVEADWSLAGTDGVGLATQAWRQDAAVASIDDDRDWLAQLETIAVVLRGLATLVGGVLIITAVFTIASVIRLAAHQHRDEIAVLRLVGATEFFIRGPFYAEGMIQGVLGAVVALAALATSFVLLRQRFGDGLLGRLVAGRFLSPGVIAGLVLLGAVAGLVGAVVSLGRERVDGMRAAAGWGPAE